MQRAQKKGWQACCKQYKRIQLRIHETVRVWLACMCMCMCVHISEKQTWRPFLFFWTYETEIQSRQDSINEYQRFIS